MDYEFGDIIDCRKIPSIEHFILVLGLTRKNEVMYFKIFSRVYTVFKDIVSFFNDCIDRNYPRFFHYFNKEKEKQSISLYGRLSDALFLDKTTHYNLCLDQDSMVVINSDPLAEDKNVLDQFLRRGIAHHKSRLADIDIYRLRVILKCSGNISLDKEKEIRRNFNIFMKIMKMRK